MPLSAKVCITFTIKAVPPQNYTQLLYHGSSAFSIANFLKKRKVHVDAAAAPQVFAFSKVPRAAAMLSNAQNRARRA
jgi:hypothetical protein